VDCSGLPFARGWRFISRAVRGVLQALSITQELFDPSLLQPVLCQGLARIQHTGRSACDLCKAPLSTFSIITADVDQAFEACAAGLVVRCWLGFAHLCSELFSTQSILVQKGRRVVT